MYVKDKKSIPSALVTISLLVILLSFTIAATFLYFNNFTTLKYPFMYKSAFIFLFIVVNMIWIMLVYVALLKEYNKIFIAYFIGIIASIGGVYLFGRRYGVAGALAGYAAGQFLIVFLLLAISHKSYPLKFFCFNKQIFSYFKSFGYLFLMGMFFNFGIWIDKIIYWFYYGIHIKGTIFYFFIPYDIPVFLAYLSMIPGLVYFLIITEPMFHTACYKFVKNIHSNTLKQIKENKNNMRHYLNKGFLQLVLFQGVWTLGLVLNSSQFINFMGYVTVRLNIMNILFVAVFFHLIVLTLQIYLLYLEFRKEALIASLIYFLGNFILTFVFIALNFIVPGLSYLLSALLAAFYSAFMLFKNVPHIDYIIFNRN